MVESILLAWHRGYLLLLVAATVSLDSDSLPPLPCCSPYIVGTTFTTVHILLLLPYFFLHLKFLHSSILMLFHIFVCYQNPMVNETPDQKEKQTGSQCCSL